MRSNEELDQIAMDLAKGLVFSDWQIANENEIWMVFQCINMMTDAQRAELATMDIGMLYEYKTAAVETTENGIPIFATMNILTKKEAQYIRKVFPGYYERLKGEERGSD